MMTRHIYIASCSVHGGIYHCLMQEGSFRILDHLPCDRPMYMDMEGDVLHILLREPWKDSHESALMDCRILPDGSVAAPRSMRGTGGKCACHLCHAHGHVYVTNYLSGNVTSTSECTDLHSGCGPNPLRQEMPHTHCICPAPDGRYLLCTDLGLDTIYVYDDSLHVHETARVPTGHGCRHLAFSEDGSTVFCANELESTVTVFAYDSGHLTCLGTWETIFSPDPTNTSAAIRVSKNHIYVSQRGADAISFLEWDSLNRRMTLNQVIPCGGVSPRDFIVLDGQLLCANEKSNTVTLLTPTPGGFQTETVLNVDAPLCILSIPA